MLPTLSGQNPLIEPNTSSEGLQSLLVFSKDAKPHLGGLAEYLHRICEALGQSGVRTVLATPVREGPGDAPQWHEVIRLPSPYGKAFDALEPALLGGSFRSLIFAMRARRWARRWAPKLVATYQPQVALMGIWSGLTGYWADACARLRVPVGYFALGREVGFRGRGLAGRVVARNRRRAFARAQIVFAVSRATADAVAALGVPRSRIVTVPPGIEMDRFPPAPPEYCGHVARSLGIEGKRIILTISRLVPRKGISTMIDALPFVLREAPDCVYVIAGFGDEERALRRQAAMQGLANDVVFVGTVSEETKRALYQLCDVFVLPCRDLADGDTEGFGIVFLEAGAYGKPVVAGRAGGVVDAVIHGETGLLVEPGSPEELATAVARVLHDEQLAGQLGRGGRAWAETMTWQAAAATVRTTLDRLVAAPNRTE